MSQNPRCPSEITLMSRFGVSRDKAQRIRGLMRGEIDPEATSPSTAAWARQCYHRPSDPELIMHAIDVVLGTFGVEGLGKLSRWDCSVAGLPNYSPVYEYCNSGDAYADTIIRNNRTGSYCVGCWGTLVENNPRLGD